MTETPAPLPVQPPRFRRWALGGLLLGLVLGGGYGLWDGWATSHSRERQEAEIHAALAVPHMDGARYYARVYAVRYQSLESLLAWRGGRGGIVVPVAGEHSGPAHENLALPRRVSRVDADLDAAERPALGPDARMTR